MNEKIEVEHTHSWSEIQDKELLTHRNLGYVYNISTQKVTRILEKKELEPPCRISVVTTGNDRRISGEQYVDVEVDLEIRK